jgi:two-component system, OmpR family, phosphate regulon response regulator PhoB
LKPLVLISSANADFYLLLDHILESDGFATVLAGGVEETHFLAVEKGPQAIILDCQSGTFSGAEICARLKMDPQTFGTTTVALIGPGAESQYVDLLQAGVDESFVRPMVPAKLLAFLRRKLVNRPSGGEGAWEGDLRYDDIEIDTTTRQVRRNGAGIDLGPIEFKLLRHLLEHPEQVLSRDELISAAWPANMHVRARTVDAHIVRLRRILKCLSGMEIIHTVHSVGYVLGGQTYRQTCQEARHPSAYRVSNGKSSSPHPHVRARTSMPTR